MVRRFSAKELYGNSILPVASKSNVFKGFRPLMSNADEGLSVDNLCFKLSQRGKIKLATWKGGDGDEGQIRPAGGPGVPCVEEGGAGLRIHRFARRGRLEG